MSKRRAAGQLPQPGQTLEFLAAQIEPGRRVVGIDFGTKSLGVAISDPTLLVATPLATIARTRLARDLEQLRSLLASDDVGGVVVGLPVEMDGGEGPRCQAARQFGRDLGRGLGLPVAFWDERLSTAAVERMLVGEADLSRRRRGRVIDRAAAAYILQGALDYLRARRPSERPPSTP